MSNPQKHAFEPMLCPAMRAKMGSRWYYVGTMTFGEIARAVQPVPKMDEKTELKHWIQRELRDERTEQIAVYLRTQKQRFFNALVLGIYGGEPEWQPVAVEENLKIKGHELDERQSNAFGMVHLSGAETIFAIDGQHRVEGIRAAVAKDSNLEEEEQAVIFIAHLTTDAGREQTRRLFATLNTYARPISDREKVAISEDDSFAKATRQLVEKYPGLGMEFVPLLASPNIPPAEKACVTTVVGLFQLTEILAPSDLRAKKKKLHDGPSDDSTVSKIYDATAEFFDGLKKSVPEIREAMESKPSAEIASKYRHREGGHLLFRPVGLKAFARATRTLMDRGVSAKEAVARLVEVPLDLTAEIWKDVFWQHETKTMLTKYVQLAQNIFLDRIGEKPEPKTYSVAAKYENLTGRSFPKKVVKYPRR